MSLPATLSRAISVLEGLGVRRYREGRGEHPYEDLLSDLREELERAESRREQRRGKYDRRVALEGEEFRWAIGEAETVRSVRAATPGDGGKWWCLSCGVACEHNLDRDLHCQGPAPRDRRLRRELGDRRARHVLGWFNFTSGHLEAP